MPNIVSDFNYAAKFSWVSGWLDCVDMDKQKQTCISCSWYVAVDRSREDVQSIFRNFYRETRPWDMIGMMLIRHHKQRI